MIVTIKEDQFEVAALNRTELTSDLIRQWEELEARSIEGNAYLSPHFILPAIKHLTPNAAVIFLFITRINGNTKIMTGAGVFEYVQGSRQFPLPHLRAYHCIHSYLSGLLVDEAFVDSTLAAFFMFVRKYKRYCCGVEFHKRTGDTTLAGRMDLSASQLAIPWYQYDSRKRVILVPNKLSGDTVDKMLSSNMKKKLRYGRNVLSKHGEIHWNVIKGHDVDKGCVDRFLKLEHMGWKGENGTSLLSTKDGEAFFHDMIAGFSKQGHALFTELTVNNRTISSTSNMLSAKTGFAFKIGWDPEFAAASPGILNEVEFVKIAADLFPHIEYLDSGAEEGSYIGKLWTDSYSIISGYFVTKPAAKPVAALIDFVRRMKQQFSTRKAAKSVD